MALSSSLDALSLDGTRDLIERWHIKERAVDPVQSAPTIRRVQCRQVSNRSRELATL